MKAVLAAAAIVLVILGVVVVMGSAAMAPAADPAAGVDTTSTAPVASEPITVGPTTTTTTTASAATPTAGGFEFEVGPVDAATRAKMGGTWRPGCPVLVEDLRHVTLTHFGFDGTVHHGELLVAADVAESLQAPFRRLFEIRYPIQVLTVTDGEDVPWDESTAFNCRKKVGKQSEWSEHSYGRAIDVNPVQNPYVSSSSSIVPEEGRPFADRSRTDPGVLHAGDPVVAAFEAAGWHWGGVWTGGAHDYMHFSTTGQ